MTRLDKGVFARCSNLKKVTLGSHMGYLCEACFSGIALTELYVRASIPPVWQDATTFGGLDASDCTVYVPSDQLEKYKYHTTWGKFKLRAIPE